MSIWNSLKSSEKSPSWVIVYIRLVYGCVCEEFVSIDKWCRRTQSTMGGAIPWAGLSKETSRHEVEQAVEWARKLFLHSFCSGFLKWWIVTQKRKIRWTLPSPTLLLVVLVIVTEGNQIVPLWHSLSLSLSNLVCEPLCGGGSSHCQACVLTPKWAPDSSSWPNVLEVWFGGPCVLKKASNWKQNSVSVKSWSIKVEPSALGLFAWMHEWLSQSSSDW